MKKTLLALALSSLAFIGLISLIDSRTAVGAALDGVIAEHATSSTIAVGPQQNKTLFTENEVCTARVVTTVASPVMLSFSSSVTPSGTVGHLQAASTSVAYDSSIYGCTDVTAYAFASSTITKTELR